MNSLRNIKESEKKEFYPLSPAQKRLFLAQQINPESVTYNLTEIMSDFSGDVQRVEASINCLIDRHEILRTTFHAIEGMMVQVIQDDGKIEIDSVRHSNLNVDELFDLLVRPFDLGKFPLIRLTLVHCDHCKPLLFAEFHHIIFDATSVAIFLKLFDEIYSGKPVAHPEFQYKDYAEWFFRKRTFEMLRKEKAFWENQLVSPIPVLELPTDFPRPRFQSNKGSSYRFIINKKDTGGLTSMAGAFETTLFTVLLGIFKVFLYRLTGQQDIIVGVPVAGRNHPGVASMLGMFVNTIPVRSNPSAEETFISFLRKLRGDIKNCLDNQDFQIDEIVEALDIERDHSRSPLFDVMFDMLNHSKFTAAMNETENPAMLAHRPVPAQFDLVLKAIEMQDAILLIFEYCTDLFSADTVVRFSGYIQNIIAAVVKNPLKMISEIEILTDQERSKILIDFNNTQRLYPHHQTIPSIFRETVLKKGTATAIYFYGQILTYEQLNARSNQLARKILKSGVNKEDIVGIIVPRSPEMIIGILGVLKAGCAYLPIDPDYPLDRVNDMINDSGSNLILTVADVRAHLNIAIPWIDVRANDISLEDPGDLDVDFSSSNLAYLIYTSGSSGNPKGVMIEHKNVINFAYGMIEDIGLSDRKSILCLTTISFDIFVLEAIVPLLAGMRVVLAGAADQKNPKALFKLISEQQIDFLQITPSHLRPLLSFDGSEGMLSEIKVLIVGGEAFPADLLQNLQATYKGRIFNMYGPTETTVWSAVQDLSSANAVTIGRPIANTSIRIINKYLQLQPVGVAGELCIGGDGVSRGYWNREQLTSEKFITDPFSNGEKIYRTGDLAKWLPDGSIEFVGRVDNQVKIRGFRIELGEIESQLSKHELIREAIAVVKIKDEDKNLVVYYTAVQKVSAIELRNFLSKKLPNYMVPSYFVHLDDMPLTANGKVNRKALPEPSIDSSISVILPCNEIEEKLLTIWSEVLKTQATFISVDRNFLEIGGDSLKALTIISRIHKAFDIEFSITDFFNTHSIRSIAERVVEKKHKRRFVPIEKCAPKLHYATSSSQKRMYFLYELNRLSFAYNYPAFFRLEGEVDIPRLNKAIKKLIFRHEALRTSFELIEGVAVQRIQEDVQFEIEHYELGKEQVESAAVKFIRPFVLSSAPLIRVGLLQTSLSEYVLMVDIHHIITDGISQNILIRDFLALYNNMELPELHLQYKDFAEWQQNGRGANEMEKAKQFWVQDFSGQIQLLDLPTDFVRPTTKSYNGSTVSFELCAEEKIKLAHIARAEDVTMYMMLLSIFNIFLAKLGNQEDIVIGTPVAGRHHADLEDVIGMFVNTLPLRSAPRGNLTFKEFLLAVKSKTLACFDYQSYPYEALIDELKLERNTNRNPLFDVLFVFQNFEETRFEIPELAVISYEREHTISKFDLTLSAFQSDNSIQLNFEFCTDLFRKERIQKFVTYFKEIVAAVIKDQSIKILDIEIVPKEERQELLREFHRTEIDYPKEATIISVFERQVKQRPDTVAVVFEGEEITYGQLNREANKLAVVLKSKGVKADHVVGLLVDRSIDLVIGILGILKAGGAYLPIDIDYPQDRIEHLIKDSKASILVSGVDIDLEYRVPIVFIGELATTVDEIQDLDIEIRPSDLCYVIYTSGTTNNPKGVMIEHRNVVRLFFNDEFQFDFGPHDVWTMFHSQCFDFSVWEIFGALLFGGRLIIIPKQVTRDPAAYMNVLKERGVTILNQVPSAFYSLKEAFDLTPKLKLRYIIFGGEALSSRRLKHWRVRYPDIKLINMYGITETTVHVTYKEIGEYEIEHNISNIGTSIPTLSVYLFDQYQKFIPQGVVGELYVGGAGVARGYLGNEALTSKKFVMNPYIPGERLYRTGDLARILESGDLEYIGRIDQQVKIRGFRIELTEVEEALAMYDQLEAVAVLAKDKAEDKCLVAYYVSQEDIEASELREFLMRKLPAYMIPAYYVRVANFPLTSNGKLDRRALPDPYLESKTYIPPSNETEEKLASIWSKILPVERICVTDDFFEVGGHSLSALRLMIAIKNELDIVIPVEVIFQLKTIMLMSEWIQIRKSDTIEAPDGEEVHYKL